MTLFHLDSLTCIIPIWQSCNLPKRESPYCYSMHHINSILHNSSWKRTFHSSSRNSPQFIRPQFCYSVFQSPSVVSAQSHINPLHISHVFLKNIPQTSFYPIFCLPSSLVHLGFLHCHFGTHSHRSSPRNKPRWSHFLAMFTRTRILSNQPVPVFCTKNQQAPAFYTKNQQAPTFCTKTIRRFLIKISKEIFMFVDRKRGKKYLSIIFGLLVRCLKIRGTIHICTELQSCPSVTREDKRWVSSRIGCWDDNVRREDDKQKG